MSLIDDIQAAAISDTGDVSALLRKCKLLAARLNHAEFGAWVDHELRGYPAGSLLPLYRRVSAFSYGDFAGAFGSSARLQIPVTILPEQVQDHYRVAKLDQAISAYEQLLRGDGEGSARLPWPVDFPSSTPRS
ncbi:hypothetical protein [Burkholderia sp. BCC1996]|uniref:AbiTii domain-containing protein n=1 Tax=unclassified Burkholderia TaxID=2613784 RepID=UPI0039EE8AFC